MKKPLMEFIEKNTKLENEGLALIKKEIDKLRETIYEPDSLKHNLVSRLIAALNDFQYCMNEKHHKRYCEFCGCIHRKEIHADFEFIINHDVIAIIDNNKGARSVTNDIDYVLWTIQNTGRSLTEKSFFEIKFYKLIYRDSEGHWDKIWLDTHSNFDRFVSLGNPPITDINDAYAKISQHATPL